MRRSAIDVGTASRSARSICLCLAIGTMALDAFAAPPANQQAKAKKPGGPSGPNAIPASRSWHTPTPNKTAPTDANGRAMLVLQDLNVPDHTALTALTDRGGFSAEDLDRAAHVLREPSSGNEHPMDPRVLDLVYRVQVQFKA